MDLRSEWFLRDYKLAATNFSASKTVEIIGHLREYDLRSKGVNNDSAGEEDLMNELFFKIMH